MADDTVPVRRILWYTILIIVAAFSYYIAQTAILRSTVTLPIAAYLACLEKASRIDWTKYGVKDGPDADDICEKHAPPG